MASNKSYPICTKTKMTQINAEGHGCHFLKEQAKKVFFSRWTKTGNVIINTLMPPKKLFPDRRSFPKIFLHDEVATAESDGVPCHKHRDTDSRVFLQLHCSGYFTR